MLNRKPFRDLQPLNLGTLAGIGVAAWLSRCYPSLSYELNDRAQLIIYGGLLGSTLYKALRSEIYGFFRFFCDYLRIFEAKVFLKARLIDDLEFRALLNHLVRRHFGLSHDSRTI